METEGVIKFNALWKKCAPVPDSLVAELISWRQKLYDAALIGVGADRIGYGNISVRCGDGFLITGTGTGALPKLGTEHMTRVINYDFSKNTLSCEGPVNASSESLTHAAVYEASSSMNAVMHVHSSVLWKKLIYNVPTTAPNAAYGTPQMAHEIIRLFQEENAEKRGVIIMSGHESGILSFGQSLEVAGERVLSLLK